MEAIEGEELNGEEFADDIMSDGQEAEAEDFDVEEELVEDENFPAISEDISAEESGVKNVEAAVTLDLNDAQFAVTLHDEYFLVGGGNHLPTIVSNISNQPCSNTLPAHNDSIAYLCFNHNRSILACASLDGLISFYETTNYTLITQTNTNADLNFIHWHPSGNAFLAACGDSSVWLLFLPTAAVMHILYGHSASVSIAQFSHSGKQIISASDDATVLVWDPKSGTVLKRFGGGDARFIQNPITTFSLHKDNNVLIVGSVSGEVCVLHLGNGKILASFSLQDSVESISYSTIVNQAAIGTSAGNIEIWNLDHMTMLKRLEHNSSITKVKFSSVSNTLFSSSTDGLIRCWDGRSLECLSKYICASPILDFDENSKFVVGACDDGKCFVFQRF